MKKLLKYFGIVVAAFIVLIAILAAFTQTAIFKNWLKNKAVALAQSYVNGQVSIEALKGNLFTHFELEGLSISQKDERVIGIRRASINYNPLALLSNRIAVSRFKLEAPKVLLVQREDKSWNIAELIKTDTTVAEAPGDSVFNWQIQLASLQIDSGFAELRGIDTTQAGLPREIRNLQLALGFVYSPERLNLSLENLSFEAHDPDLKFQMLQSGVELDQDEVETDGVTLQTKASLAASDLKIPALNIYGDPRLELKASGSLKDLALSIDLWIGGGTVNLRSQLQVEEEPYAYRVQGNFSQINLAEITNEHEFESDLNLEVEIDGKGVEWGNLNTHFDIVAVRSYAFNKKIETLVLNGDARGDSITFSGNIAALGAHSNYAGQFVSTNGRASYQLRGDFRHLNLARALDDSSMASDLSFDFRLAGRGTTMNELSGNFVLNLSPSQINKVAVDSAQIDLSLKDERLIVDTFDVASPIGQMQAAGTFGLWKNGMLSFNAKFEDLARLAEVVPLDSLQGEASLSGQIGGLLDSLALEAKLNLQRAGMAEITVGEFDGNISGYLANNKSFLTFAGEASNINAMDLDSLAASFNLTYEDSLGSFEIQVERKENFSAETNGEYALAPNEYRVILEGLNLEAKGQRWQKIGAETALAFAGAEFEVSELTLASNGQTITVAGHLDSAGVADFHARIDSLKLSSLMALFDQQANYDGTLNLEMTLSETLAQPRIDGNVSVTEGRYLQVPFAELAGRFEYDENKFNWNLFLAKTKGDSALASSGFLPFQLSLSPFASEPLQEEPVRIEFSSRGADISFIQSFLSGIENFRGNLFADVVLQNTLKNLQGGGPIRFANGQFDIPELGTKYRDLNAALRLTGREVSIEDFRVRSGGGNLKIIHGSIALSQQQIENFKARLRPDGFQVMNNQKLQASAQGEIDLSGSVDAIRFKGGLRVPQARVYYPAWLEEETAVRLTDQPFFVIAADTAQFDPGGAIRFQKAAAGADALLTETEFYKNLRGTLSLTFDRNTWFRSEEANVEVEGQLELVKESDDFVLFGTLSAVRGYYILQGNRFEIVEGRINFKGDPAINPDLYIEAVHEFTDRSAGESQRREITVTITGTKETPEFKFALDGQAAEQIDIFSILLFGKPFDKLGVSERANVAEQTSLQERATGFLAAQLIKRLGSELGSEFNLDVLQIESGEDLGDTKVRVGKYVTPNVFVSVSQDFGAEGEQKVALEYQIPQEVFFLNLFIQASKERTGNTALDVIWKTEW